MDNPKNSIQIFNLNF